jgi:hypothetical protein
MATNFVVVGPHLIQKIDNDVLPVYDPLSETFYDYLDTAFTRSNDPYDVPPSEPNIGSDNVGSGESNSAPSYDGPYYPYSPPYGVQAACMKIPIATLLEKGIDVSDMDFTIECRFRIDRRFKKYSE